MLRSLRKKSLYFYPRSPRGERRDRGKRHKDGRKFLSTLPSRGATYFQAVCRRCQGISIHAPLAGSDQYLNGEWTWDEEFLSTLPSRGATSFIKQPLQTCIISIHAPLAGSDPGIINFSKISVHFYPRSPRGERQQKQINLSPIFAWK